MKFRLPAMLRLLLLFCSATAKSNDACGPIEQDTSYDGHDLMPSLNASSVDECCDKCSNIPGCYYFTYHSQNQLCHPKSSDAGRKSTRGSNSGKSKNNPKLKPPAPKGARNVLVILVDDLRPELGIYGHEQVKTPNLDKLAASSTVFERAYCQQTVCSPSRNSFMTGRRPDRTRTWNFIDDFRNSSGQVPGNWSSLPEYFKNRGYAVYGTGKTFHPSLPANWDLPRSWDDYGGCLSGVCNYSSAGGVIDPSCKVEYDHTKNLTTGQGHQWFPITNCEQNHLEEQVVNATLIYLDKAVNVDKRPFFIAMGLHRPHLPWQAPKRFFDQYDDPLSLPEPKFPDPPKGMPGLAWHPYFEQLRPTDYMTPPVKARFLRKGYYGAVSYTDRNTGVLIDRLAELKLENNTVVAIWGDHGWSLGEHNLWEKKSLFENDARVPLLIRAPAIPASIGKRTRAFAELVDMFPTLVELAGLQLPAPNATRADDPDADLSGVSLVPVLRDPENATVKKYAFSQFPRCDCGYTSPSDVCQGGKCSNCTRSGNACAEHVCMFIKRDTFAWMGYSVRTDGWRYTEWVEWDGAKQRPYWDRVAGVELYPHQEYAGESDFDAWENVNEASHAGHDDVKVKLSAVLHAHFDSDSDGAL